MHRIIVPVASSLSDLDKPRWLALRRTPGRDARLVLGESRSARMARLHADLARLVMHDDDLPFTQLTVGGRNADRGNTACCDIVAFIISNCLLEKRDIKELFSASFLELSCAEIVAEWDASPSPAPEPSKFLPDKLRSLGCRNLRSYDRVILGNSKEVVYSLSQMLCGEAFPFGVAVTVQTAREGGKVKAFDVHKTFTIVGAKNALACFDSHVGRVLFVEDTALRGADAMAQLIVYGSTSKPGLLAQMGVACGQIDVTVFDVRGVSHSEADRAREVLSLRPTCDAAFLEAFSQVARRITARWSCALSAMGDVRMVSFSHYELFRHASSVACWLPPWLLASLFFVSHSLRFSDLQCCFVSQIIATENVWQEQSEEHLENLLREVMPRVMDAVKACWRAIDSNAGANGRFRIERRLVPSRVLRFTGGYENGPTSWRWSSFPFLRVGMLLHRVETTPASWERSAVFADLVGTLQGATADAFEDGEIRLGSYGITHKLRSWMVSTGCAGAVRGWFGGYTMSIKNKVLWRKLGGPTTGEFAALCYLPHVPIECGFQMCFIGEVWQRNMLDGTTGGLQK